MTTTQLDVFRHHLEHTSDPAPWRDEVLEAIRFYQAAHTPTEVVLPLTDQRLYEVCAMVRSEVLADTHTRPFHQALEHLSVIEELRSRREAQPSNLRGAIHDAYWEAKKVTHPELPAENFARGVEHGLSQALMLANAARLEPAATSEAQLVITDEMVERAARAMEPMAFREELTATDEWYELEQEGRFQALGRARAALTAASAIGGAEPADPIKLFAQWQHEGEALAAAAGCSFVLKVRLPRSTWTITTPKIATSTPDQDTSK